MKATLLAFFVIILSHMTSAQSSPQGTTMTFVRTDSININHVLCSPDKDTLFLVQGPTADLLLEIWNRPDYKDEKPVFIFVTHDVLVMMASLPRYARKNEYNITRN